MPSDIRLETLEFKVAHLERALQELSDVLYRQQQLLDAQEARFRRLTEQLETAEQPAGEQKFEIPPHY